MSAASLPDVGTEFGPCQEECEHDDCAATRRMAGQACVHCDEPIGYERGFYDVTPAGDRSWSRLAHSSCEMKAVAS